MKQHQKWSLIEMSQNVSGQLLWEPKKSPQKNDLERIFFDLYFLN